MFYVYYLVFFNYYFFLLEKASYFSWLCSSEASNFGSFISSLGAIGFGLYAIFSWRRWKNEKRLEKKSDRAEKLLEELYIFETDFDDWFKRLTWTACNQDHEERANNLIRALAYIFTMARTLNNDILQLINQLKEYIEDKRSILRLYHFHEKLKNINEARKNEALLKESKNNVMKANIEDIRKKLEAIMDYEVSSQ